MSEMIILWLVVLILAIILELISLGLTSIWFAGGAVVAIIAAFLHANFGIQCGLFVLTTLLLLYFTRPIAVRYFNKDRIKTNAESLVGRQAIVISEVDNLQGIGQATVGGQEWSARNVDDEQILPVGTVAEIVAIDGVKLIIKEIPQPTNKDVYVVKNNEE